MTSAVAIHGPIRAGVGDRGASLAILSGINKPPDDGKREDGMALAPEFAGRAKG